MDNGKIILKRLNTKNVPSTFKDSLKTETNLYNVSVCHLPLCSIREEISSRNCKYYQFLFQFIGYAFIKHCSLAYIDIQIKIL